MYTGFLVHNQKEGYGKIFPFLCREYDDSLYYEGVFTYGKEHCADGKEFRYQGGGASAVG
jgi:hypothetical protein